MRKLVVIKVEFEALGAERIAYTDKIDLDYIGETIKLIAPTAHLSAVSTDLVTSWQYKRHNLELIVRAHKRYKTQYKN